MLIAPPVWLGLHWPWLPAFSPHLRHSRGFLWAMPAYATAVYVVLSEFGLFSKMDILRAGHRLSGLRPIFLAYFLAVRMELLAFFAVLGFAMDRTAVTGREWSASGFIAASLMVIALTILLFSVVGTRASYRLSRSGS